MAYMEQATLSRDGDFNQRIAACAVVEVDLDGQRPARLGDRHQWEIAASPGFADAYASAVAGGVERPGADPSVISDAQILSAIQAQFPPA